MTAELETRWNRALQRVQEIEHKLAQHDMASPDGTPLPTEALAVLRANLECVWFAPAKNAKLKNHIVRTVIQEVVADLDDDASEIVFLVHWAGGAHTEIRLPRRRPVSAMQHRRISLRQSGSLRGSPETMSSQAF